MDRITYQVGLVCQAGDTVHIASRTIHIRPVNPTQVPSLTPALLSNHLTSISFNEAEIICWQTLFKCKQMLSMCVNEHTQHGSHVTFIEWNAPLPGTG